MYYPLSENKGADQLRGVFAYADCLFSHEEAHIKLKYTSSFNSIFIFLAYFNSWCDMTGTHSFTPLLLTNALLKSVDEK